MRRSYRYTVGYNYVKIFDIPVCRNPSRDDSRQYEECQFALLASHATSGHKVHFGDDPTAGVAHDRLHAREPTHDIDRWSTGTVDAIAQRHGHCVVTVRTDEGDTVELVVTLAVRDLFLRRLPIPEGASPVGERVWYRPHGGRE